MSIFNIKNDGVLDGSIRTAGSNVLALETFGTFDGVSITIAKYMGQGRTADVNDPLFAPALEITGTAMADQGFKYTIGQDSEYIIVATNAGGSTDVNLSLQELVGNPF